MASSEAFVITNNTKYMFQLCIMICFQKTVSGWVNTHAASYLFQRLELGMATHQRWVCSSFYLKNSLDLLIVEVRTTPFWTYNLVHYYFTVIEIVIRKEFTTVILNMFCLCDSQLCWTQDFWENPSISSRNSEFMKIF